MIARERPACPVCGTAQRSLLRALPGLLPRLGPASTVLHFSAGSVTSNSAPLDEESTDTTSPQPHKRSRRRVAVWTSGLVLLALLVVAGYTIWRVAETFDTINSRSTPPPVVSGAALGGSPEVEIDSGPARTAVAVANVTKTARAASADDPAPTSTVAAAATEPDATEPAPPEPTATAAPAEPTVTGPAPTLETTITLPSPPGSVLDTLPPPPGLPTESAPGETATTEPVIEPTATTPDEEQTPTATPAEPEPTATSALPTEVPSEPTATAELPTEPATETPIEPTAPIDAPTDTPVEPSATTEAATVAPSPSPAGPEMVLSEIERVENGSFEAGIEPWYVESGATVVQDAAARDGASVLELGVEGGYIDQAVFFVPGTEYSLTFAARLTAPGETAEIGVAFSAEDGPRLRDREPAPIAITETVFTTHTVTFTVPEDIGTVKVYAYKDDGAGALQVDAVSLRSVVPALVQGSAPGEPIDVADGAMTILFMGVDAREGEAIDGEVRPDSLMLVHLNPNSDSCRILSIPRDTRTELPGYGQSKINHALAIGGIEYQIQVVSDLTALEIDHYVLIDFAGFRDLVDAIGGVTIDVPESFTAIDTREFEAGVQEMNGEEALTYARHRGDASGDFGRIERQQQVIRALVREAGTMEIVSSINELLPAVSDSLRTDLSPTRMIDIANTYRSICTEEAVSMFRLEGEVATFDDPLLQMPLSYVVIDEAEIRRKVAALLEP